MFQLKFENERGAIHMGGAEHPQWRIFTMEGTEIPQVKRTTAAYAGIPGQALISKTADARTITLSGELVNQGGPERELTRASRIFQQAGTLFLDMGSKRRRIACEPLIFQPGDRTRGFVEWTLQLICDDPYFRDFKDTVVQVFQRNKLIKGSFTLPQIFSQRITETVLNNLGDVRTDPVFFLHGGDTRVISQPDGTIHLYNHTTGQDLTVNRELAAGEILTVDIPNRQLVTNLPRAGERPDGVLYCVSENTYLSNFWLELGKNRISLQNQTRRELYGTCVYNNCYGEAVL